MKPLMMQDKDLKTVLVKIPKLWLILQTYLKHGICQTTVWSSNSMLKIPSFRLNRSWRYKNRCYEKTKMSQKNWVPQCLDAYSREAQWKLITLPFFIAERTEELFQLDILIHHFQNRSINWIPMSHAGRMIYDKYFNVKLPIH